MERRCRGKSYPRTEARAEERASEAEGMGEVDHDWWSDSMGGDVGLR